MSVGLGLCSVYNGKYVCGNQIDPFALADGKGICLKHVKGKLCSDSIEPALHLNTLVKIEKCPKSIIENYILAIREGGMPSKIDIDNYTYMTEEGTDKHCCMRAYSKNKSIMEYIRILELVTVLLTAQEITDASGIDVQAKKIDMLEWYIPIDKLGCVMGVLARKLDCLIETRKKCVQKCLQTLDRAAKLRKLGAKPPQYNCFKKLCNDNRKLSTKDLIVASTIVKSFMSCRHKRHTKHKLSHSISTKSLDVGTNRIITREDYMDESKIKQISSLLVVDGEDKDLFDMITTKISHMVDPQTELKMVRTTGKSYTKSQMEDICNRLHINPPHNKKAIALSIRNRLLPPTIILHGDKKSPLSISTIRLNSYDSTLLEIEKFLSDRKKVVKGKIPNKLRTSVWRKYSNGKMDCKCFCCKCNISWEKWHCGHIVSERNGGKIEESNLIPVCGQCNSAMGTANMHEYMVVSGFCEGVPIHAMYLFTIIKDDTELVLSQSMKYHKADFTRIKNALNIRTVPFAMRIDLIRKIKGNIRMF